MLCSIRDRAQLDVNACFFDCWAQQLEWLHIVFFSTCSHWSDARQSSGNLDYFDLASYFSMLELLEVVYWLIDHMTNLLSDIRRNGFLFHKRVWVTMLCSIRDRAQSEVNVCFLIIGRNSWHDLLLHFSVLALTEAMCGRLLELLISFWLRIVFVLRLSC